MVGKTGHTGVFHCNREPGDTFSEVLQGLMGPSWVTLSAAGSYLQTKWSHHHNQNAFIVLRTFCLLAWHTEVSSEGIFTEFYLKDNVKYLARWIASTSHLRLTTFLIDKRQFTGVRQTFAMCKFQQGLFLFTQREKIREYWWSWSLSFSSSVQSGTRELSFDEHLFCLLSHSWAIK